MQRTWQGFLVLILAVGPLLIHPWVHPTGEFTYPDSLQRPAHKSCGHSHGSCPSTHDHGTDPDEEGDSEQGCNHYGSLCAARCESIPLDIATRFITGWLGSLSEDLVTAHLEPVLQWLDWPQPLSRRGPPSHLS